MDKLQLSIDLNEVPEFREAKTRQELIVKNNPFVEITNHASYELAKQRRTALRKGRFDLQNGEKAIAAKLKEFRDFVKTETQELINITLPFEEKQQSEVEQYEAEKQREREEKARAERERIERIRANIQNFREKYNELISCSTVNTITGIIEDIKNESFEVEEFVNELESTKNVLISQANDKKAQLDEAEHIRVEREKMEAERKAMEAERIKREKEAKAEREKIEAERAEQERKLEAERREIQAERERIEREESEKRVKAEAEQRAKEEAEQKAIQEKERKKREEAERKANEAHQKKVKKDRERLENMVKSLTFEEPEKLDNQELQQVIVDFRQEIDNIKNSFILQIQKL